MDNKTAILILEKQLERIVYNRLNNINLVENLTMEISEAKKSLVNNETDIAAIKDSIAILRGLE